MRLPLALTAAIVTALAGVLAGQAPASAAQPKPLMVGAAEDAAKEGGALEAEAKMSLARLMGGRRRRLAERDPADRLRLSVRIEDRPAVRDDTRPVRGVRRVDPTTRAFGRLRDRRERAEPEPLLDAAVHEERPRRRRLVVPRAARPDLRRDQAGVTADDRDRRVARPSRQRQPGAPAAHAFAGPFISTYAFGSAAGRAGDGLA